MPSSSRPKCDAGFPLLFPELASRPHYHRPTTHVCSSLPARTPLPFPYFRNPILIPLAAIADALMEADEKRDVEVEVIRTALTIRDVAAFMLRSV